MMLRDKFKSLMIFSLSAITFLEMYIALFPSIKNQSTEIDKMIKAFPPEMFKAMGMDPATLSFGNLQAFLSSEYMSFLWPIMVIVFAVSLANYICVNDVEKGTIETVASLPLSRKKIFIERYLAGLMALIIFCLVGIMSAVILATFHELDFVFINYITTLIGSIMFAGAIYSIAVLCSAIFSEKGKASMVTSGIIISMYVLYAISILNNDLKNLKYFSFFNYFNGTELLTNNQFPNGMFVIFGFVIAVTSLLALKRFNKRDLSV